MFEIKVNVAADGELRVKTRVPPDISPGDYRAILVLEESAVSMPSDAPKPPLRLKVFDWPAWPANSTFHREETYDDDDR